MPKIRLKTGNIEIEVEGNDQDEIKRSLKEVLQLIEEHPPHTQNSPNENIDRPTEAATDAGIVLREGTINTAIARLGGDTCKAVLAAAAAHLVLFQGKDRFSDEDWEATAKAANWWKAKWSNEKAKTKKRLIDSGFVIENSPGVYSLSSQARAEFEGKLAH